MAEEFVDRAFLDIDGTTIECTEVSIKDTIDLEAVKTMNPQNRAIGWVSGIPEHEITATVPLRLEGSLIPWRKYLQAKTEFVMTILYVGGQAVTYMRCRLSDVEQASEQGSRTDTKITAKGLYSGDN